MKKGIEFKCNKCGKQQPKNEDKSNETWDTYDANKECDCGGKFVMFFNGEQLEK